MDLTTMFLVIGAIVLVIIVGGYFLLNWLGRILTTPKEPRPGLYEAMKEEAVSAGVEADGGSEL